MDQLLEKKFDSVVQWLRDQVEGARARGLILGISGGIDSALCAYLIKRAFPEHSLGVIMPCGSNPQDEIDGMKVVEGCGINYRTIDLTETHDQLFRTVEQHLEGLGEELNIRASQSNLKARLRMSTIYGLGNALNYLVVGTDNAAEMYTGYFTKYGDGGVDLLPIANLTKREVREWARAIGVHEDIITKPPTAGLWDNQSDENEMGITYDVLDDFLEGKEVGEKELQIINRLHQVSAHKRQLPPSPPNHH